MKPRPTSNLEPGLLRSTCERRTHRLGRIYREQINYSNECFSLKDKGDLCTPFVVENKLITL